MQASFSRSYKMKKDELDIIVDTKSKWLAFLILEHKPKTVVIEVGNKIEGCTIGIIKWYPAWRCYAFEPYNATIYEKICLRDIANILEQLTVNQRNKKNEENQK